MSKSKTLLKKELESEYQKNLPTYNQLVEEVYFILESELDKKGIKYHVIHKRIKDFESFYKKARRDECERPYKEIHDIVGLRIVALFLSDIPLISEILKRLFKVIDKEDKFETKDEATFGYMDIQYIVKMEKKKYKGHRYDKITNKLFEIQVRTIAMDAWASISHHLDYKSRSAIPKNLRRDFYALSGLFYVADQHFEMFFRSSEVSRKNIDEIISSDMSKLDEELNLDSLKAYLSNKFPDREESDPVKLSLTTQELSNMGYKTLSDIDKAFNKAEKAVMQYEKDDPPVDAQGKESKYMNSSILRVGISIADEAYLEYIPYVSEELKAKRRSYRKFLKTK